MERYCVVNTRTHAVVAVTIDRDEAYRRCRLGNRLAEHLINDGDSRHTGEMYEVQRIDNILGLAEQPAA